MHQHLQQQNTWNQYGFSQTWEVLLHKPVLQEGMPPTCSMHVSMNNNKTQKRLTKKVE